MTLTLHSPHDQTLSGGSTDTTATVRVVFIQRGQPITVESKAGLNLLEVARQHGIDLEGACEGSLACSTCHVYVDSAWFDKLEEASVDEEDMLDLAFEIKPTSRLGCQIVLTPELDGLVVTVPDQTRHLAHGR